MSSKIGPSEGNNMSYRSVNSKAATLETRISYNSDTKTFEPLTSGVSTTTEHMEKVQGQMSQYKVPQDYSSPTFLQKIAPTNKCKATPIDTETKGVKEFMSGDAARFPSFLKSIRQAQRSL